MALMAPVALPEQALPKALRPLGILGAFRLEPGRHGPLQLEQGPWHLARGPDGPGQLVHPGGQFPAQARVRGQAQTHVHGRHQSERLIIAVQAGDGLPGRGGHGLVLGEKLRILPRLAVALGHQMQIALVLAQKKIFFMPAHLEQGHVHVRGPPLQGQDMVNAFPQHLAGGEKKDESGHGHQENGPQLGPDAHEGPSIRAGSGPSGDPPGAEGRRRGPRPPSFLGPGLIRPASPCKSWAVSGFERAVPAD